MIDYGKFQKALRHLSLQHENYLTLDEKLPPLIREAVAESVIQRFEVCYDCLWKVLKRHLIEKLGIPDPPNSPKPVFRMANENSLLPTPIENWIEFADARIDTSHDYSGEKLMESLARIAPFIEAATLLSERLTDKKWG